ncbi:NADPH oxidase [Trichinella spiralis]|uniref:NADPH oxidase n=3 Tax=Trichinella TaxID=6333 RepID=A0ABR3K7A6_TRISP
MNACDVTSGAGRPFEYYGDQQPEQVYNRSVLQELDMISTMNIKFNKISDFTLYWFILAVALFLFISIKLQSKKRPSSGIKQKV